MQPKKNQLKTRLLPSCFFAFHKNVYLKEPRLIHTHAEYTHTLSFSRNSENTIISEREMKRERERERERERDVCS